MQPLGESMSNWRMPNRAGLYAALILLGGALALIVILIGAAVIILG